MPTQPSSSHPAEPRDVAFGGSCACGRITYTSTATPSSTLICHCTTCRKLSGGPYQCFTGVTAQRIAFHDSQDDAWQQGFPKDSVVGITFLRLSKSAERAFCVECHAPLAMRYLFEDDTVWLALGSVDERTVRDESVRAALKPQGHIFASQAVWWDEFGNDGLRVSQRFGGRFEEDMKDWESKRA